MILELLPSNSKVSYDVLLSGQFAGGLKHSPSGHDSHGAGCLTVLTLMWPLWCKPSVGAVMLMGLLEKLPA